MRVDNEIPKSRIRYRAISRDEKLKYQARYEKLLWNQQADTQEPNATWFNVEGCAFARIILFRTVTRLYPLHLQGRVEGEFDWDVLSASLKPYEIDLTETALVGENLISIQGVLKANNIDYSLWGTVLKRCCLSGDMIEKLQKYEYEKQYGNDTLKGETHEIYDRTVEFILQDSPCCKQQQKDIQHAFEKSDFEQYEDLRRAFLEWVEMIPVFPDAIQLGFRKSFEATLMKAAGKDEMKECQRLFDKPFDKEAYIAQTERLFPSKRKPTNASCHANSKATNEECIDKRMIMYENLLAADGILLKESPLYDKIKAYFPDICLFKDAITKYEILDQEREHDLTDIPWDKLAAAFEPCEITGKPKYGIFQNKPLEIKTIITIQDVFFWYDIDYSLWGILLKHFCLDIFMLFRVEDCETYDQVITHIFKYFDFAATKVGIYNR